MIQTSCTYDKICDLRKYGAKKKIKKWSCLQPLKKQFPAGQTTFTMGFEYWSRSGNISPACAQLICGADHQMDIRGNPVRDGG